MADLAIEYRQVDDLIPYARNARTHSEKQVAEIAASIREFGWTNPILVDGENGITAGHGRVLAARKLGMDSVPVIELSHLTPIQRQAYILADNKLALNAGWDDELLALELADLDSAGFDLALTGFGDSELAGLMGAKDGLTDPDAVPDEPERPVSVAGDVWQLGKHRIICGDSCNAADVSRLLGDVTPHLMVTDPPYGVEYDANWRNEAMPAKDDPARWKDGAGRSIGKVANDDRADWSETWALFPGEVAYVWHADRHAASVQRSLESSQFEMRAQIIWAKASHSISRGHYHWQHEPCWYAVRKGGTGHWSGDRTQTTLWEISHAKSETGHSTQKPVECMRRPIENNSVAGDAVYEPFSGSGTTIIAAEQTGRACYAAEIHPAYVDMAVTRWQEFTGQEAVHADSGKTFKETTDARHNV